VDLAYGNGAITTANARIGYVYTPLTSLFVDVTGNTRNWQVNYFNSAGVRVVGGVLVEQGPGGRIKGEAWAGYINQQYSGITMQAVSTWTYGFGVAALVTDEVTAVVEGRREAKEAALSLALLSPGLIGASDVTCTFGAAVCVSVV
jgi:hypothetical protein